MARKSTKTAAAKTVDTTNTEVSTTASAAENTALAAMEEVKAGQKAVRAARTTKAAAARTEEKETVKKTTAKRTTVKKAETKLNVVLQFSGKSYTQEDLMMIAKDVWTYDLNNQVEDLEMVELYVKPEENLCYYVMNNNVTGKFGI